MKGLNTKTRYQVKLMLMVAALALFYESSGWSAWFSLASVAWMVLQNAKLDSIKNLWWTCLAASTCFASLILSTSSYITAIFGYEMIQIEKVYLLQQCLACTLIGSIISSAFSEKEWTNQLGDITTATTTTGTTPTETKQKQADTFNAKMDEKKEKNVPSGPSPPPTEAFVDKKSYSSPTKSEDGCDDDDAGSSKPSKVQDNDGNTTKDNTDDDDGVVVVKKEDEEEQESSPSPDVDVSTDYDIPTDYEPDIIEDEKMINDPLGDILSSASASGSAATPTTTAEEGQ